LTIQPPMGKVSMFLIDSIDKFDFKHPKKTKNSYYFKINLINSESEAFGKSRGNNISTATDLTKSSNKSTA